MKVFIATDIRCVENNGRIYVSDKVSKILNRYCSAFGKIILCARVYNNDADLNFVDITDAISETVLFRNFRVLYSKKFKEKLISAITNSDLVIGRFESFSACRAYDVAKSLKKTFFGEVMSDPWDGLWNHGFAGKLIASYAFVKTKKAMKNADYALYVTSRFLQKRYPCKNASVGVSNVYLKDVSEKVLERRIAEIKTSNATELSLMTTAAVHVKYKGQAYVIKAISKLKSIGIRVKYYVVGEGDQTYLRSIATKYNVSDQVVFTGKMPLDQVFKMLDKIDLYIQPSLQEGLPRSVIEAMSRGCACIGARTAGIPELLEDEFVVRRKSVSDIVALVQKYSGLDIEEKIRIAKRNFDEAKKYEVSVLDERRNAYYERIKAGLKQKDVLEVV